MIILTNNTHVKQTHCDNKIMQTCPDNLTPLDDAFYDWFFTEMTYLSTSDLNEIKNTIKMIFKKFYQLSEPIKLGRNKRPINLTKEYQYIRDMLVKEKGENISDDEIYDKAKSYRLLYLTTQLKLIGKRNEKDGIYTNDKLLGGLYSNSIYNGNICYFVMFDLWWESLLSLDTIELVVNLYNEYYKNLTEGIPMENEFEKYYPSNFFPNFYQRNVSNDTLDIWELAKWDVKSNHPVLTEIDTSHPSKENQNITQSLTEKEEITILEKDTIDRWKDKIVNISLYMKSNRNSYDLTIYHKVLGKKYWIDKDTINKLIGDCHTVDLHVLLTGKHHVLPVHDINKIILLDEDAFIQYLYDRIHSK